MKGTILAVDDSSFVRELLNTLLKSEGFEVILAANGSEALEHVEKNKPDLILMDVVMPGDDGFKTAKKIRSIIKDSKVPILFLTSKGEVEDKKIGFALGGQDYIVKPFDQEELLARVNRWMEHKVETQEEINRARYETLTQLMITLAHYINNSLASMQGRAQITSPDNPEQVQKFMNIFFNQSARIRSVVESLEEMAERKDIQTTTYLWQEDEMLDITEQLREKLGEIHPR